jgi:nucleolar complex protein 3
MMGKQNKNRKPPGYSSHQQASKKRRKVNPHSNSQFSITNNLNQSPTSFSSSVPPSLSPQSDNAVAVPLPTTVSTDEEDNDHQLQADDLDLLNHYAHGLDFLADLPTAQLNAAVSKKKLPTDKGTVLKADTTDADFKRKDKGRRQKHAVDSNSEEDDDGEEEDWEKARRLTGGGGGFRNIREEARAPALPIKTLQGQLKKAAILESDVKKKPKLPFKRMAVVKAGSDDDDDDDDSGGSSSEEEEDDDGKVVGVAMLMKQAVSVAGITIQDDLEEELKRQKREKAAAAKRAKEEAIAAAKNASNHRKTAASAGDDQNKKQSVLQELAAFVNVEDRREEAKQRIAVAAQSLLATPESSLPHLRTLLELSVASDLQIARLAMLSCVAVFIDILPGYRIRLPTEKELEIQVSKEVQKLRDYESALLRAYQAFLKTLLRAVNGSKGGQAPAAHGRVALKCMCNLLTSLAHFNYTSDLLQVIVPNSAAKDEKVQKMCCEALTKLLSSSTADHHTDSNSSVLTEAVQLLADMLKRRKCICSPEVMTPLLSLQFTDITSAEDFEAARERSSSKKKKKKNKKNGKKDEVDRDFQEAQAVVDLDSRKKAQTATIEAMFEAFFRVLKATTSSGLITSKDKDASLGGGLTKERFDKRFPLLYPTLQGLEKYAYLISIDYFPDLVAELELLLASETLPPKERLRCLLTVAHILKGQGQALTVDRKAFYLSLYAALQLVIPCQLYDELEEENDDDNGDGDGTEKSKMARNISSRSRSESESGSESAENLGPLLCKVLEIMILETKLLDTPRLAAFARRIAICASAATDSGTALGLLCILYRMLRKHPKVRMCLLENELGGPSGVKSSKMDAVDPAEAGALAVPLWELSFLAHYHYHPHVAKAAGDIACMIGPSSGGREGTSSRSSGGIGGSSILPLALTPSQLAARTSTATGGFTPAPAKPAPISSSSSSKSNKKRKADAKLYSKRSSFEDTFRNTEEGGQEEDPGFGRYFKTVKRHTVNASLRRENDLLMAKLELFKDHLSRSSSSSAAAAANTAAVDMKK